MRVWILLLCVSCTLFADVPAGKAGVRVFGTKGDHHDLTGIQFSNGIITGQLAKDNAPVRLNQRICRLIQLPITGEDTLASLPGTQLDIRESKQVKLKSLPEAIQIRLRVPEDAGLYLTPLVREDDVPRKNSFRIWFGEKRIHGEAQGTGRTEMLAMRPSIIPIPEGHTGNLHVELFIQRKEELCYLRVNHQLVRRWKLPRSFEEADEPGYVLIRSGIKPQQIEALSVHSWSSGLSPEANITPEKQLPLLWLQNGDTLPATIRSIQAGMINITLEDGSDLRLPLTRVREIHFPRS